MDIERLEELRKRLEYNSELEDEEIENLWELIDEAIDRQSATSEEVRRAIQTLKNIYPSPKQIATGEYPHVAEAIDIAITALKEYQPWVSIGDRLPERGKHVLLCCEVRPSGARYVCDNWGDYSSIFTGAFATHWKSLPEPPKGE